MQMNNLLLLVLVICSFQNLHSQVAINVSDEDPAPSSMLDISSTNKGLLIPRMSDSERMAIQNKAAQSKLKKGNRFDPFCKTVVSILTDELQIQTG